MLEPPSKTEVSYRNSVTCSSTLIQLTHHYILYCESALCQFFH